MLSNQAFLSPESENFAGSLAGVLGLSNPLKETSCMHPFNQVFRLWQATIRWLCVHAHSVLDLGGLTDTRGFLGPLAQILLG